MDTVTRALNTLGLSTGATRDDIARSYKDLVRVWHPDRLGGDPGLQERAQEKMKEINSAFQLLQREYGGAKSPRRSGAGGGRAGSGVSAAARDGSRSASPPRSASVTLAVSVPGWMWLVAGLGLLFILARRHFLPGLTLVLLFLVLQRLNAVLHRNG